MSAQETYKENLPERADLLCGLERKAAREHRETPEQDPLFLR
jgi:hypothetical protein